MQQIILALHTFIHSQPEKKFYMWPASAHSISLFACGFDTNLLTALLDNSPNKIGKYLHSYNLYCESFTKIVDEADPSTVILIGGAGQYIKDIAMANPNVRFVECTSLI